MKLALKSGLAVAAMSAAILPATAGTAHAQVWLKHIEIQNRQDGINLGEPACIVDIDGSGYGTGTKIDSCWVYPQYSRYYIESVFADAPGGAYANVQLRSEVGNLCLTVINQVGPGGFGNEVSPRTCNRSAAQEWASTRSRDGYINYFNFQYRECLDGGYGDTYGYPENGCSANGENRYQDWDQHQT
jgi:hypothetical protein